MNFQLSQDLICAPIDIDPKKIEAAKHNAKIYGVENRIEFIVGDFFQVAPKLRGKNLFWFKIPVPKWSGQGDAIWQL